jgi:hypothetical protein
MATTSRHRFQRRRFALLTGILLVVVGASERIRAQDSGPGRTGLDVTDTVTRHRVTWKLSRRAEVGRFVNGDCYVVGPVTVVAIDPPARDGRNGSVLNLPIDSGISGFDHRVRSGRYERGARLRVEPPIALKPGDALVSSISVDPGSLPCPLRPSDRNISPVASVSVLTCLDRAVPSDAFRPAYCDRGQQIWLARNLRSESLPSLDRAGIDVELAHGASFTIGDFARLFERPWLDVCFFHFDAPAEYQPQYGREAGRAVGIAALLLCLDFPREEKQALLIGLVQYGIDLWGMIRSGHRGWPAHGGHGTGRKLPLVLAGMLLGDSRMASPNRHYPHVDFGEDMQTVHGRGWSGATALYAGHVGKDGEGDLGPYEDAPPDRWPGDLGESYRRCCTSVAWVGEALALRLLKAEPLWNHPAFFDYVDRWMTEDDSAQIDAIRKARGKDYSAPWARQRQAWDPFVDQMWARYRRFRTPAEK